jgi:hypothetical protein
LARNALAALRSCRRQRPDGERIYVILDNLNSHKGTKLVAWRETNNAEVCFTPTYGSWANPIEAHFGPLREFMLNKSSYNNHAALLRACPRPSEPHHDIHTKHRTLATRGTSDDDRFSRRAG